MQMLNYYLKKQKNVYILCVKLWGGGRVYSTQKSSMLYFLNKIIRVGDNNKQIKRNICQAVMNLQPSLSVKKY